ncbi:hypothetical protein [Bacillus sp. ISL-45]|uniref:hypothetical protein n=1 Tax=Bacillus sp. ISL-45 TaxID=2819128 RepID=UPI001BE95086|nr:hypothetical protein [Bacillus sp. ISL-45]
MGMTKISLRRKLEVFLQLLDEKRGHGIGGGSSEFFGVVMGPFIKRRNLVTA